ncbi:MAG TPA: YdiU family protein [Moheibacter sp.]|nr:YdiU family protein [Moheibacter sp.]
MANPIFNFHDTYKTLSTFFYRPLQLNFKERAEMMLWNHDLATELNLDIKDCQHLTQVLSGQIMDVNSEPIAQAYAGHQFGHFTMLGDGRTALLGEHLTQNNERFDVQLKGSGTTPFSRRGDGKSTFSAVLREYLFSEALHHLGIPTSRSLAAIRTSEVVDRGNAEQGGILTRIMRSHLRVGTFEFARAVSPEHLEELFNYTIDRHFKTLKNAENPALSFLKKVMNLQMDLVLNWLRVGFIHGVMNTDNTSIIGETFDYGPCAFMGNYEPYTVFSSIDHKGRYAYAEQKNIIQWNMARLAESLLTLIHPNENKAIELAQELLTDYAKEMDEMWYEMLGLKLGIIDFTLEDRKLVDEFLALMQENKKDFNHSFTYLRLPDLYKNTDFELGENFDEWKQRWNARLTMGEGRGNALSLMEKVNPVYVLKNHFVEKAISEADQGDLTLLNQLLDHVKYPYTYKKEMAETFFAPDGFDESYQTFCNT